MEESPYYKNLKARLGDKVIAREELSGRDCAVLEPSALHPAVKILKEDFDLLADLGGADYSKIPGHDEAPLCVSYQFVKTQDGSRAWLKVYLPMQGAEVDSLTPFFTGANWYERECFDMYGVKFKGHPYLKRLLLYEEFQGHPLLKEYPLMKAQPLIPMRDAVDYEAVALKNRAEGKAP